MMFDKSKSSRQSPPPKEEEKAVSRPAPSVTPSPAASAGTGAKVAMIGEGISVTGDVAANSNLRIEGRIEGRSVACKQDVEVAESGVVKASITARVVKVAGAVAGDISGTEKVFIGKSGRVQGNIVAPRVQLEDGALFRGSIDMNPAESAAANKAAKAEPAKAEQRAKPAAPPTQTATGGDARKEPNLTLKSG